MQIGSWILLQSHAIYLLNEVDFIYDCNTFRSLWKISIINFNNEVIWLDLDIFIMGGACYPLVWDNYPSHYLNRAVKAVPMYPELPDIIFSHKQKGSSAR